MNPKIALSLVLVTGMLTSCRHQPDVPEPPVSNQATTGGPNQAKCNPDSIYFQKDILPLLVSSCGMSPCHDSTTKADGVWIKSYTTLMGSGVVKAGKGFDSDLYQVLVETDPDERMPRNANPLSPDQIAMIKKWIDQGALNNDCDNCDTMKYTWSGKVSVILQNNCVGCHSGTGASAGIHLESYQAVKDLAGNGKLYGAISHEPGYKPMPKGGKLKDCEIISVKKWIEAGAPNN